MTKVRTRLHQNNSMCAGTFQLHIAPSQNALLSDLIVFWTSSLGGMLLLFAAIWLVLCFAQN